MIFVDYIKESFLIITVFSLIPLLCTSSISLIVSILQAMTQVQESSISFLVKISILIFLIYIFSSNISELFIQFMEKSFNLMSLLGQLA